MDQSDAPSRFLLNSSRASGPDRRQLGLMALAAAVPREVLAADRDERARPSKLRLVSTRGEKAQNYGAISGANRTVIESRARIFLGRKPSQSLRLVLGGYYVAIEGLGVETDLGNDYQVECALECRGKTRRWTWGGAQEGRIAGGAASELSDPLESASFGLEAFPPGEECFVRMRTTYKVGDRFLVGPPLMLEGESGWQHDGGTSQVADVGPMSQPTGGGQRRQPPPFLGVVGQWRGAADISVAILGDSIGDGVGDTPGDGEAGGGFIRRALWLAGKPPWVDLARPAARAENANLYRKRAEMLRFCTHVICEYGLNDVDKYRKTPEPDEVVTEAVARILLQTWATARQDGRYLLQTTLSPRVTSGDRFATLDGQRAVRRNGPGEARTRVNALIERAVGRGLVNEVFDVNRYVATVSDDTRFKVDGRQNSATRDGVHWSPALTADVAGALAQHIRAWRA
jgi:lysophospholipase L1-like esterase